MLTRSKPKGGPVYRGVSHIGKLFWERSANSYKKLT